MLRSRFIFGTEYSKICVIEEYIEKNLSMIQIKVYNAFYFIWRIYIFVIKCFCYYRWLLCNGKVSSIYTIWICVTINTYIYIYIHARCYLIFTKITLFLQNVRSIFCLFAKMFSEGPYVIVGNIKRISLWKVLPEISAVSAPGGTCDDEWRR